MMGNRYKSLLNTKLLNLQFDNVTNFELSNLKVYSIEKDSVENLRLGKQIERWISCAIKKSNVYELLHENIQVFDGKITIGEFDFLFKSMASQDVIHLEVVYKFYLYKPSDEKNEFEKWIGPNLKDCLTKKIDKLRTNQFPLLFKEQTKYRLPDLNINKVKQCLCFMSNLFVPFSLEKKIYKDINNEAIVGYWYKLKEFQNTFNINCQFLLPDKTNWGLEPSDNKIWLSLREVMILIKESHARKFSPLCWVKNGNGRFSQCFVVWW